MRPFKLERYFARFEFSTQHLLSPSDCESLTLAEVLALADGESRALWDNLKLGYTESQGHPLLREAIAELYETIAAEQLLVCAPEEGIFIAMQLMLRKSEAFIYTAPAYQSLYEIAAASGCRPHPLTLRIEGSRWQLDLDELRRNITRRTRMLVINFPHNPTGFVPSRAEYEALLDIAREHDLLVFSDEMYRWLEHDPADRLPAACDVYENAVSLCGMSKSLSLPGARIGWLATRHPALLNNFIKYRDYTTICSSATSEVLALMTLRAREHLWTRNRATIAENLALAEHFFDRTHSDKFRWLKPQGGSIAFPALRLPLPVADFAEQAAERESLMILPGSVYDFPGNHFRVGLGRRHFPEALAALESLLGDQK